MLPQAKNGPSGGPQGGVAASVASEVCGQLPLTNQAVAVRKPSVLWATMPEASVNKNGEPLLPKDEIRPDGQGGRHAIHSQAGSQRHMTSPSRNASRPH